MDLPLERIHPSAFAAAQAAECARLQGRFWEMHEVLFENAKTLEPVAPHAEAAGLDMAAFETCMSSEESKEAIRSDMATARSIGATGTPAFLVGITDPDDPNKVTGVEFIKGARHISGFKLALERALKK